MSLAEMDSSSVQLTRVHLSQHAKRTEHGFHHLWTALVSCIHIFNSSWSTCKKGLFEPFGCNQVDASRCGIETWNSLATHGSCILSGYKSWWEVASMMMGVFEWKQYRWYKHIRYVLTLVLTSRDVKLGYVWPCHTKPSAEANRMVLMSIGEHVGSISRESHSSYEKTVCG